jgi:hypothetical protein
MSDASAVIHDYLEEKRSIGIITRNMIAPIIPTISSAHP